MSPYKIYFFTDVKNFDEKYIYDIRDRFGIFTSFQTSDKKCFILFTNTDVSEIQKRLDSDLKVLERGKFDEFLKNRELHKYIHQYKTFPIMLKLLENDMQEETWNFLFDTGLYDEENIKAILEHNALINSNIS